MGIKKILICSAIHNSLNLAFHNVNEKKLCSGALSLSTGHSLMFRNTNAFPFTLLTFNCEM